MIFKIKRNLLATTLLEDIDEVLVQPVLIEFTCALRGKGNYCLFIRWKCDFSVLEKLIEDTV